MAPTSVQCNIEIYMKLCTFCCIVSIRGLCYTFARRYGMEDYVTASSYLQLASHFGFFIASVLQIPAKAHKEGEKAFTIVLLFSCSPELQRN